MKKYSLLFTETGEKRIADNTLVALTLRIAVSKPEEKETMIKIINERHNNVYGLWRITY